MPRGFLLQTAEEREAGFEAYVGRMTEQNLEYILELLEAGEMPDDKFAADARYIGYDDFELAQILVDRLSGEVLRGALWLRKFHDGIETDLFESKTLAFDAALAHVAYRFDLKLLPGSGRCR